MRMKLLLAVTILSSFWGVPHVEYNGIEYVQEEQKEEALLEIAHDPQTIEEKIRATFPESPDRAVAIAKCESGLNPKAVSPTHDSGLMQLNDVHDTRLKELGLDKFDVDDNLTFARILYDERGWKPWACNNLI